MIDFSRAIATAWERMAVILFRPFDPTKWALLGFIAFLAQLAESGTGINSPFGTNHTTKTTNYQSVPQIMHAFHQSMAQLMTFSNSGWLALSVGFGVVYLAVWLALIWVGCRSEFVFLDNIVRNRAALAWPWKQYAPQGNAWFLLNLILVVLRLPFLVGAVAIFLGMNWTWIAAERQPDAAEIMMAMLSVGLAVVVAIIGSILLFLVRSLGQPLYFMQTMTLPQTLRALLDLVLARPGSIALYLLVNLLLGFGAWVIAVLIACVTCCVVFWVSCVPFLGGLLYLLAICELILPILVFMRCFQLDCLAQFGPQYDVWNIGPATGGPTAPGAPLSPPPPLG